jgi:hypothetical protein
VVCNLLLQADCEGPALISHAASLRHTGVDPFLQFIFKQKVAVDIASLPTLNSRFFRTRTPALKLIIKRCLTFAGSLSGKKSSNADIFIKVGPMDSVTFANQSPVSPLRPPCSSFAHHTF